MTSIEIKIKFLLIRVIAPAILKSIFIFFPRKEKTLLIVRSDGVGDYILFRNYLYFLKSSAKYKQHKICVLENFISKDLATHWDAEVVERFIWYSDGNFLKWELIKLLWDLQRLRTETIIYSNYSRKFTVDWLIDKVGAKNKIAVDGDCINAPLAIKNKGNRYYSELLRVDAKPLHEFARNKQIFELITGEKCLVEKPVIEKHQLNLIRNYSIVIFAGAGHQHKTWAPSHFNRFCQRVIEELKTPIILAGGNKDADRLKEISEGIRAEFVSCKAELSLIELCELIGGANLLISGDTAAIHIAALLDIPAVCIVKGDLYGRFIPYPPGTSDHITCVFPRNYHAAAKNYDQWSPFTINDVMIDDVFNATAKALTSLMENKN
jgi:ADP-heptose:LPS heptosyltransferase